MAVVEKELDIIILLRLQGVSDATFKRQQAGLRNDRSFIDQTATLRIVMDLHLSSPRSIAHKAAGPFLRGLLNGIHSSTLTLSTMRRLSIAWLEERFGASLDTKAY